MASWWESLKDSISGAVRALGNYTTHSQRAIYEIATGGFDNDRDVGRAWDDIGRAWGNVEEGVGHGFGAMGATMEAPGVKQINQGLEWAYREGVSRPITTPILHSTIEAEEGQNPFEALFDGDAWAKAYQASKNISPGQAITGADGLFHEQRTLSEIQDLKRSGAFDEGALKWTSGTIDFTSRVFLDPTVVGGKAAGAARLKYVKPLSSKQVLAGKATQYTQGSRFARVEKVITEADSADEIRVRLLNDNANGAAMAHVMYNTRHDPELLRIAVRAGYGEAEAFDDLLMYNQSLMAAKQSAAAGMEAASDLGRLRRGDKGNVSMKLIGTSQERAEHWDDYVAQMAADKNVFDQAVTFNEGLLNDVKSAPLAQTGAAGAVPAMRDSMSSRLRFKLHQTAFQSSRPTFVRAPLESIVRTWLTPSNRRIHGINLVDDNSDKAVRSYLDRAGLPREQQTPFLDRYMAATGDPSQRMLVMAQAEDAVIRHIGNEYGYSSAEVQKIVDQAAKGRGRARFLMANKHKFMAADVADELAEEGEVITWLDEDGARHVMPTPVLESQFMDVFPVADPSQIHTAMKNSQSPVHSAASTVVNELSADLDAIHRLWKPTVLLGLGWPVRALSDEVGRSIALYGMGTQALGIGKGFKYSAQNMVERGATRYDAYVHGRNRERIATLKGALDPTVPADARFMNLAHAYTMGRVSTKELVETTTEAAKIGAVDDLTAAHWRDVQDGVMTKQEFANEVVVQSLKRQDRHWFTVPLNQKGILDEVQDVGKVSIDPTTGNPFKPGKDAKVARSKILKPDATTGRVDNDDLHDFVRDNLDHVVHPDGGIVLERLDDGSVKIDAYTPKVGFMKRRQMSKQQMKDFTRRAHRGGNKPVMLNLGGEKIEFEGVLEGAGERLYKEASSDDVYNNWMAEKHELTRDRIAASSGWSDAVEPGSGPDYGFAWERAANAQLGNDRAARQFLAGFNFDMVKDWALTEPDGKAWARQGAFLGDIDSRLARVQAMVEHYVPDKGDLRAKVLEGRATFDDLHALVPEDSLKPQVHGEQLEYVRGAHKAADLVRRQTHKMMEKLGTVPGDKFSRYPFLDKSYRAHLKSLADLEFKQRGSITQARKFEIEEAARKRALADVKKWLYNSDMVSEGAQLIRHMSPFSAAWQDGLRAWSGIILRERPQTAGHLWNLSNSFERAGLIVDSEGRQLKVENGEEVWYEEEMGEDGEPTGKLIKHKPEGEVDKYVQIQLPSWLTPDQLGKGTKVAARINKSSFNTFMHLNPGAGPVVTVPTSEIVKRKPTLENNPIVKAALPFGPNQNMWKNAMSNELRKIYEVWEGEDDSVFRNQAMAIFQAEVVKYNQGQRTTKPTFDEATEKAGSLMLMRTVLTSVLPVSPNFMSPFQAHIDSYRQLQAKDPQEADRIFYERHGDDFFILTARVTKGLKGLPPTMESYKATQKYRDMIEQYPEIAGAIVGDVAGAWSKSVYEWQKSERISAGAKDRIRELMDLRESVEDAERRLGWMKYGDVMDVVHAEMSDKGVTSLDAEGMEDLKFLKENMVQQLGYDESGKPTPWLEDYLGTDPGKQEKKMFGLRQLAQDERLLNREDIQGLADYFEMRDSFVSELATRDSNGGAKTLEAKDNEDLALVWNEAVFALKDSNLMFSRLYDRYLTNDKLKV